MLAARACARAQQVVRAGPAVPRAGARGACAELQPEGHAGRRSPTSRPDMTLPGRRAPAREDRHHQGRAFGPLVGRRAADRRRRATRKSSAGSTSIGTATAASSTTARRLIAKPTPREKTGDVWTSFSRIELSVPYGRGPAATSPSRTWCRSWAVRPADGPTPDIVRYSVDSWRSGTVTDRRRRGARRRDGRRQRRRLRQGRHVERPGSLGAGRAQAGALDRRGQADQPPDVREDRRERSWCSSSARFSPDGRTLEFAVVDRPVTKAADRAGDDGRA